MSTTTTHINVRGMTCDHCAAAVRSELSALDDVSDVRVDLDSGEVTVVAARPLDPAEVDAAVDEAGYEVVR